MNNNKLTMLKKYWYILLIIVVIIIVIILLCLFLKPKTKEIRPLDKVTKSDSQKVLSDYAKITFDSIDSCDEDAPQDICSEVKYTITNISKENRVYNFEILAYDENKQEIGHGYILVEKLKAGEQLSDEFILESKKGTKDKLDISRLDVVKAYSE